MVGLMLSGIVIAALYNMFITASYVFLQQDQTSLAQLNLRYAIEQVKDDMRRAGLYATPNSERDTSVCPSPDPPMFGVIHIDAGGQNNIPHFDSTNREVLPDRLFLSGNLSSASSYPAQVTGQTIRLQLPAWVRDPGLRPPIYTDSGFSRIFRPDQYVRLTNVYGSSQILPIQSVNTEDGGRQVVLEQPPRFATSGVCGVTGTGDSVEVNPVNFVEYWIASAEDAADASRTDLVRSFVDHDDGSRIDGTDLVVGEHIVDFQVWFMFQDVSGEIPEDADPLDDAGNLDAFSVNGDSGSRPDLIRTAVVRVCARTDMEDENWMHRPRESAQDPLVSFDVDGVAENGSARVVCLSSEVEVVNLTLRSAGPTG